MEYSILGKTGIKVSRLCFGSLTVGPLQANLSVETGCKIISYAFEHGINFIDSAQLYQTYPYIRAALKKCKSDIVISSKTYAYTREMAMNAVEQARMELDRDTIDIFMLHEQESIYTLQGHKAALEYLFECKQKGIIKAVGASMHHIAAVYGAIELGLDVIHPLINIDGLGIVDGTREQMEIALKKASKAGIGIFSMKPLGGGNLFKKAGECLDYIFGLETINSVAIGMQGIDEVDANLEYFEKHSFSENSKLILSNRERKLHIDDWCEGCGKCKEKCSQKAIEIIGNQAVCEHQKCILCGYCSAVCPVWAIKVV
jgi:predicted aldo/keto reductase-like oxidoreductase